MTNIVFFSVIIVLIVLLSPIPWILLDYLIKKIRRFFHGSTLEVEKISIIQDIVTSMERLIKSNRGASIIIDVKDQVNPYLVDSEYIDAMVSSNLIVTIFEGTKTPLHDGAIVIKNNRIEQASSYITKLSEKKIPKYFGTRHRSALGISEVTNAIVVVLSEERSKVTIFNNGKFEEIFPKDLFSKLVSIWIV